MNEIDINPEIIVERCGNIGTIILNRPKKLNALSLDMIRMMSATLKMWEKDEDIKAVIFKGAGDRAFCAGGDIVSFYHAGMEFRRGRISLNVATLFFAEEYSLNRALFHYKKPILSFMNGITMGGGYGIAGNTRFKIASETTIFAMPETRIGFFTDIGAAYHFRQMKSAPLARYLAMSGENLSGRDVYDCGLATHFVCEEKQTDLENEVLNSTGGAVEIAAILERYHVPEGESDFIAENQGWIEECFAHEHLDNIMNTLAGAAHYNAKQCFETLQLRSPTSVAVCLEYFNRAENLDFDTVINMDYALSRHFASGHDFYEGIRATLIDRDKDPQWEPESLEAMSPNLVAGYFEMDHDLLNQYEKTA